MYASRYLIFALFFFALLFMGYQNTIPLPDKILELEDIAYYESAEGNFDKAIQALKEAVSEAEIIGLENKKLDLLEQQLQIWANRDDLPLEAQLKGIESYWKAPHNKSSLFKKAYFDALTTYYFYADQLDSMQLYYDKTMEVMQSEKLWKDMVGFNSFLAGEAYYIYGDFFLAKDFIDEANRVLKTKLLPNGEDFPDFYTVQAVIAQELGDYEEALAAALKSVDYLVESEDYDTLDLIYEYNNLGAIYNALEDFSNAEKFYKKALNISQRAKDPLEESISLYNLGSVYYKRKEYSKSFEYRNSALGLLSDIGNEMDFPKDFLNCYLQISDYYIREDSLDSAQIYAKKALILSQKTNYRKQVAYEQLARIESKKKNFPKAVDFYNKALELDRNKYGEKHPNIALTEMNIAGVLFEQQDYTKSAEYLQNALYAVSTISNRAKLLSVEVNPSVDSIIDMDHLLKILNLKAKVLKSLHQESPDSIQLQDIYPTALLATEVLTRINQKVMNQKAKSFWLKKEVIPTYERAIQLALTLHKNTGEEHYLNEAFQLAERSKSVLLTEALQEQNAGVFGGVPDSLIQKEQRLNRLLAQMRKKRFDAYLQKNQKLLKGYDEQIFQLEHDAEVLKRELEANYPKYYELKYEDNVVSIQDIQSSLDDNSIFIEYFYGNEELIAFQIQKNQASAHSIPVEEGNEVMKFQNLLANVAAALENPKFYYNDYISKAYEYYQKWLEPIVNNTEKERLILVADGPLGYIPFESLLTKKVEPLKEESVNPNYAELPYLLHQFRISYNYSGTLWLQQRKQATQAINGKILALAPTYDTEVEIDSSFMVERSSKEQSLRSGLLELPGAAAEIDLLAQQFQGEFLKAEEASEKNIKSKAADFGILHLAMHGLVDEENPEFSSLAMTEDKNPNEDNFFYAYEIKQLDLKASLVVLSACETGAGKYQRGEGVVSIGRGFMYAGAPSLLMTLWSLNDQSSLPLIEAFYANLSEGMEKDEALQKAKIKYLEKTDYIAAHPALWACFIQLGNYDSIELEEKTLLSSNFVWIFGGIGMILALGLLAKRSFNKRAA